MLDLLFPVFNAIQAWIARLMPLTGSIAVWGGVAGIMAMSMYTLTSNQAVIAKLKMETSNLRRQMLDPALEDQAEFTALAIKNLKVSLTFLGKVIGPALFSAIPVLVIAVWLETYYGYTLPEEQKPVPFTVFPADSKIMITPPKAVRLYGGIIAMTPIQTGIISIYSDGKLAYSGNPFSPPIATITIESWWKTLLTGNSGYLKSDVALKEIKFDFPRKKMLENLPEWAAGWELTYFLNVMIAAVAIKIIFKVH